MKGTTPPWLITTSPKSLFSLYGHVSTISQRVVESELTPRHCEWRAVSVLVQYVASCYPGQRYQPTREFRRPNIPRRQQDRLVAHHEHSRSRTLDTVVTYQEHQRQHAVHNCLASGDGARDQPGTGGRPWQNVTVTCFLHSLSHPRMTFRLCL